MNTERKDPTNYEEAVSQFLRDKARRDEERSKEWRSAWKILYIGVPAFILVAWALSNLFAR